MLKSGKAMTIPMMIHKKGLNFFIISPERLWIKAARQAINGEQDCCLVHTRYFLEP
jgi:hypothetical protein